MSKRSKISLGCDPEMFLTQEDPNTGILAIIPAIGLVGGTKDAPLPIPGTETLIQEDGVAVEFNIRPQTSVNSFIDKTNIAMRDVANYLYEKNKRFGYHIADSFKFQDSQLASAQARTLGCDPDLIAYERGAQRAPPTIESLGNLRCTGGHVHVGFDIQKLDANGNPDSSKCPGWAMVMFIEAGAYLPYLQYDIQSGRRPFYGLGGLYREKDYGIEYRTPSARWVNFGNRDIEFIRRIHVIAAWVQNNLTRARSLWEELEFDAIRECVNSGKLELGVYNRTYEAFRKYGVY